MSTLQPDDLFLVNRDEESYTITYEELSEQLGGGLIKPIDPSPGDGNNTINPMPPGSGTELDPYILTPKTVDYGGSVDTDEIITYSNQVVGAFVMFEDENAGTNGTRFKQPLGVIGADGTWSGRLTFVDTPESTADGTYTGLIRIGETTVYYQWAVTAEDAVIPPPVVTQYPFISSDTEETGDPINVDTRAGVTNATFTSSAWFKDGLVILGATSTVSYIPTEPGVYKYREIFTGDDGSTVEVDSNELTITEDLTKPNATMYGLRFDGEDNLQLTRIDGVGNRRTFTYSAWVKPTLDD